MDHQQSKGPSTQRRKYGMTLLLLSSLASGCDSFVQQQQQPQQPQQLASSPSLTQLNTAPALPDLSEVLDVESSCVEEATKEFLDSSTEMPLTVNGGSEVSSFAPPLSYDKYLTMQSKRVAVSVRYSEKSGLRPYYLTVAKRIKEAFPDVVLDKVLLPRVEVNEHSNSHEGCTFQVLVDGKIVVRSPSRKGLVGEYIQVFVNMQEIEIAISRARKRRRPQTVYGEDDSNARLEVLRNKARGGKEQSE
ncbi:unnamed protein product [Cylindrotheca closterium]|uniref:Selenoprotein F/M domain-containing protein n=1 Tax=Cylindrotheca closterium TaxID=2856 RepID=A0AAD2FWF4_9STRA|nr:unnamed protein product [Cylindrotheca closterium]